MNGIHAQLGLWAADLAMDAWLAPTAPPAGSMSPQLVVSGGDGPDTLSGGDGDDTINGNGGADSLIGGGGDDRLYGYRQDGAAYWDPGDTLIGGAGDDVLSGGAGDNQLDGGDGFDRAVLSADGRPDEGAGGVALDLSGYRVGTAVLVDNLQYGHDALTSIEGFIITGTFDSDTIIGSRGDDYIGNGFSGLDQLSGGGGDDTLESDQAGGTLSGGAGDDWLIFFGGGDGVHAAASGGSGHDRLTVFLFNGAESGTTASLSHGAVTVAAVDGSYSFTASGIEELSVYVPGPATLSGGSGDDSLQADGVLNGRGGDDILSGSGTLAGGEGSDTLFGGNGADTLSGGKGQDLYGIELQFNTSVPVVDASGFDITGGRHVVNYGVGLDTISGFEGVRIDDGPNTGTLIGSAGDDRIGNSYGADSIFGGAGDDLISQSLASPSPGGSYGDGNDTIDGGAGFDTLDFSTIPQHDDQLAFRVDLSAGTATSPDTGTDMISGIEAVVGYAYSDTLLGANGDERLDGYQGDDSLAGGRGEDTLIGGEGADTLDGGASADVIDGGVGADVLTGGAGADRFLFSSSTDSAPGAADRITDLGRSDVIDLSGIDADAGAAGDQAFHLVAQFSGAVGELVAIYDASSGLTTFSGDVDGDGKADLSITADGDQSDHAAFVL